MQTGSAYLRSTIGTGGRLLSATIERIHADYTGVGHGKERKVVGEATFERMQLPTSIFSKGIENVVEIVWGKAGEKN